MNPKDLYETYFSPSSAHVVIHAGSGKSYVIDPKDMKAHDLSKKSSHRGVSANAPQVPPTSSFYHLMMQEMSYFYGSFDPLKGTPWGAAADRFEEAVAAAGTELEWR